MKSRPMVKDLETALNLFYHRYELNTADIKELFGCSDSTANRLKNMVKDEQKKENIKTFSSSCVNVKCAYKIWGIDIIDIEKRIRRYQKIKGESI